MITISLWPKSAAGVSCGSCGSVGWGACVPSLREIPVFGEKSVRFYLSGG